MSKFITIPAGKLAGSENNTNQGGKVLRIIIGLILLILGILGVINSVYHIF